MVVSHHMSLRDIFGCFSVFLEESLSVETFMINGIGKMKIKIRWLKLKILDTRVFFQQLP